MKSPVLEVEANKNKEIDSVAQSNVARQAILATDSVDKHNDHLH